MHLRNVFFGLALTLPVLAADPFSGTWVPQPEKSSGASWAQYEKAGDAIRWTNSGPTNQVFKLDGSEHPSPTGRSTTSWKQIDKHTFESTVKEAGKVVTSVRMTISPDGNSRTVIQKGTDSSGRAYETTIVSKRAPGGPSDPNNLLIGRWEIDHRTARGTFPLLKIEINGNKIRQEGPAASYEAAFDGKDYPVKASRDADAVAMRRIDERTIESTLKAAGKVLATTRSSVSPDGKTLTRTLTRNGVVTTNVYMRQ